MATRTRIVLKSAFGECVTGGRAVRELIQIIYPKLGLSGRETVMKKLQGNKKEKLLELSKQLPPNTILTLIQEPKRTRRGRSLYWKNQVAGGAL